MRNMWTGAAALALALSAAAPSAAQPLGGEVQKQMPSLMKIYDDLHANPELSFMEVRSAGILAAEARKLGFAVTENVGRHRHRRGDEERPRAGGAGAARGHGRAAGDPGQTGAALTRQGAGDRPRRRRTGVMHACGHDSI